LIGDNRDWDAEPCQRPIPEWIWDGNEWVRSSPEQSNNYDSPPSQPEYSRNNSNNITRSIPKPLPALTYDPKIEYLTSYPDGHIGKWYKRTPRRQQPRPPLLDSLRTRVKSDMLQALATAKDFNTANTRHDILRIDPSLYTYTNSVSVLTGAQGTGKTITALTECVGIAHAFDTAHMFTYIKKKVYDPTFENVKPIIESQGCRVLEVEYSETEEVVQQVFPAKQRCNQLIRWREQYR
jgi:hypothetical protein